MSFGFTLDGYWLVLILFMFLDILKYVFGAFGGNKIRLSDIAGDLVFALLNGLNIYFKSSWVSILGVTLWFTISVLSRFWMPRLYGSWITFNWIATNNHGKSYNFDEMKMTHPDGTEEDYGVSE